MLACAHSAGASPAAITDRFLLTIDATDGVSNDYFGWDVDTDGRTLIVSAPGVGSGNNGAAYLIDLPTRRESAKYTRFGANDSAFWGSMSVEGTTALVSQTRVARLIDTTTGRVRSHFSLSPGVPFPESFGESSALADGVAVIGAPRENTVLVFDDRVGAQRGTLIAGDSGYNDHFGYSVAVDGGLAVIGAPFSNAVGDRAGAAYVFDLNTGAQLARITAPNPTPIARFGTAVAIENGVVLVGAPGGRSSRSYDGGTAYLFDATTGSLLGQLTESSPFYTRGIGGAVALDGGLALIGGRDPFDSNAAGQAFVFDAATRSQVARLAPPPTASAGGYGASVTLGGGYAIVGSPNNGGSRGRNSGSVFVFDVSDLVIPEPATSSLIACVLVILDDRRRKPRVPQDAR
jgi:hypothetical protein